MSSSDARRTVAASIARLVGVSVDRVVVRLIPDVAGRRLFLGQGRVQIDYTIRVAPRDAGSLADNLRATPVANASHVFAEELMRSAALSNTIRSIRVVAITAHVPIPLASSTPSPSVQPAATKARSLSLVLIVIGCIMGVFCLIQVIPCLWARAHPLREVLSRPHPLLLMMRRPRSLSMLRRTAQAQARDREEDDVSARFCGICLGGRDPREQSVHV